MRTPAYMYTLNVEGQWCKGIRTTLEVIPSDLEGPLLGDPEPRVWNHDEGGLLVKRGLLRHWQDCVPQCLSPQSFYSRVFSSLAELMGIT